MKPVYQTIISDKNGDCFRACIASLLEWPIEYVPNFIEYHKDGRADIEAANVWLAQFGLGLFGTKWLEENADWFAIQDAYCIFSVPSQKFEGVTHAVVGQLTIQENGSLRYEIVHDPNPNNEPYPNEIELYRVEFLINCSVANSHLPALPEDPSSIAQIHFAN